MPTNPEDDLSRMLRIAGVGGIDIDVAGGLRGNRSPEYLRLHGLPPETHQETHQQWLDRVHPDDREQAEHTLMAAINGTGGFYDSEYRIIRPSDGAVRWIHARAEIERDTSGRPLRLIGAHLDVTGQKQMQEARAEELRDTHILQDISNHLVSGPAPDGHFTRIVEAARRLMRSEAASIQELNGSRLRLMAHVGFHPDSAAFWQWVDAGVGSSCGRALAARERFVISDMEQFDAPPEDVAAYSRSDIASVQSTPLVSSTGQIVGMMSTHWRRPHGPDDASFAFFDILARLAADFIERMRAEAALRESEARLTAAFASVPVGIGVFGVDGRAVLSNDEFRRFLPSGTVPSRGPERGHHWQAWDADGHRIPPQDFPSARALRGERVIPGLEMLYTDDNGVGFWTHVATAPVFDGAGQITGCISVINDITERKTAEVRLRESEARYRDLFESMRQGYIENELIRDAEGRAVDYRTMTVNPQFERLTGISANEAVGRTARELVGELDPVWIETYDRVVRTGEPEHFEREEPALGRWFEVQAYPLTGDRFAILYDDITERRRTDAALRESEERQAFLLKLSDALRPLEKPQAIIAAASRLLGQYLSVDRVAYGDMNDDGEHIAVPSDWGREGTSVPPLIGTYRVAQFGQFVADHFARHEVAAIHDARDNPAIPTADYEQTWGAIGVRAAIAVAVVKAGKPRAGFAVYSALPRHWTESEQWLVDEVGNRIWDAVERARIESDLREREQRLTVALEAGRMGTYRLDLNTGQQEWSDGQYEIFGLPKSEGVPSREAFVALVHPEDRHLIEFSADDIRTPGTYLDSEFRIIRPDGETRRVIAHALAVFGPDSHPAELIGVNQDVTAQRQLEAAMHSSEERLNEFSEASSDVLWIRRADDLQWEYLSPAFHKIYGISRQDALRGDNLNSWMSLIVPEDREHALANIEMVRRGERVAFEYRVRRPQDGQIRWLRNTDFPIRDETGKVVRIGGIGHDLTELKHAEEHQRFLLAELQHRVRNTLAVIRSIVRRTADTTEDKDEYFMHLDGRIAAFARVQAAVTRDPAKGVDLGMLIADELRVVGAQEGHGVSIEGPAIELIPKAAETLGLAVHELTTNAVKYGALSVEGGSIDVSWTLTAASPTELQFDWIEGGLHGVPASPSRRGFGTEVLERTLAYELKGTTRLDYTPMGLHCHIVLPLSAVSHAGA